MGITYSKDHRLGVFIERWEGVITLDLLREHWQQLFQDDGYLATDKTLICLNDATPGFPASELRPLIETLIAPYRKQIKHWNAILVTTQEQARLAELYLAASGETGSSRIFWRPASALEWLEQAH